MKGTVHKNENSRNNRIFLKLVAGINGKTHCEALEIEHIHVFGFAVGKKLADLSLAVIVFTLTTFSQLFSSLTLPGWNWLKLFE